MVWVRLRTSEIAEQEQPRQIRLALQLPRVGR